MIYLSFETYYFLLTLYYEHFSYVYKIIGNNFSNCIKFYHVVPQNTFNLSATITINIY